MKNLLFILMFVPLISIGQQQGQAQATKVNVKTTTVNQVDYNVGKAAVAEAMSEPSLEIKTPLTVDLYNYTHIALVDVTMAYPSGVKVINKSTYKMFEQLLINSPLTIINPVKYDKKKYKKNKRFLRDIKNPSWLYLYYSTSMQSVDEMRSLVIRDSKNQIIYNVKARNITKDELVTVFTEM